MKCASYKALIVIEVHLLFSGNNVYSKACEYEQKHEADVLRVYSEKGTHRKSGLVLNAKNPFNGNSPDEIISRSR